MNAEDQILIGRAGAYNRAIKERIPIHRQTYEDHELPWPPDDEE